MLTTVIVIILSLGNLIHTLGFSDYISPKYLSQAYWLSVYSHQTQLFKIKLITLLYKVTSPLLFMILMSISNI